MDVAFDLSKVFENSPVERLDQTRLKWITPRKNLEIVRAIDRCGEAAAKFQKLRKPLTSYDRIMDSPDPNILYLYWQQNGNTKILGYLKIVKRKLYLRNQEEKQFILEPFCVLDFFVFPEFQNTGVGKQIFDYMLEKEELNPSQLAYDKPNEALLSFLEKNYGLKGPIWQATSFAVFPEFFEGKVPEYSEEELNTRVGSRRSSRPVESLVSSPRVPIRHTQDLAGDIIHGRTPEPPRLEPGPETPRGRKNTRDFGHSNIFG